MNCIKKLPWSAGAYKADIKYYPQDRVFCEGSVFASLKEQTGNKPKVTVEADGSYSVTEGWMLLAPGNTESGSGVTDYTLLENKPSINGHTLEGDQTAKDLGLMPEGGAYTKEEADGRFETKEKAASDLKAVTGAIGGKVDKVAGKGLSTNDYTSEDKAKVQTALQKESDPTVPDWAKAATKPAYTAQEVGALPDTTKIPSKVSELENDSGYLTEHQPLDGYAKKTELPSKTSQLTNDSGFIDSTALAPFAKTGDVNAELKKKADKSDVEPYDCSWVFRLANGSEVTYEQYSELDRVIRSGRPLYALYKERNSSVIGYVDSHSDDWTEIGFLLYTSYGGGIRCVISDRDMVNDGHYTEVNTSYWGLQQLLVSGTNIKTVNGVSVLGSGDIKTPAPTKVSELENDKGYLTEHQPLDGYAKTTDLAKVATSGKYEDLSGKPTILTESEVQAMINTAVVSAINTEV